MRKITKYTAKPLVIQMQLIEIMQKLGFAKPTYLKTIDEVLT